MSASYQIIVSEIGDFEVVYINDGDKIVQSLNGKVHAPMSLDAIAMQLNRTANQHEIVEVARTVIAMWDGMKPCIDQLRAAVES